MEIETCFHPRKFMGTWYQLALYPSQSNISTNYNTMVEYTVDECPDRFTKTGPAIIVRNKTLNQGKKLESTGLMKYRGDSKFRIAFSAPTDFQARHKFELEMEQACPNYIVDRIWTNAYGEYIFAVITNSSEDHLRDAMYLLSRYPQPSKIAYDELMRYLGTEFDRSRIAQTPHYW